MEALRVGDLVFVRCSRCLHPKSTRFNEFCQRIRNEKCRVKVGGIPENHNGWLVPSGFAVLVRQDSEDLQDAIAYLCNCPLYCLEKQTKTIQLTFDWGGKK